MTSSQVTLLTSSYAPGRLRPERTSLALAGTGPESPRARQIT
jgi:hypothetical protein